MLSNSQNAAVRFPVPSVLREPTLDFSVSITSNANAAEADWRAFESEHVASPYQSFDWLSNWARHVAPALDLKPLFISVKVDQALVAMMPLSLERKYGLTTARWMADELSNSNLPVMSRQFAQSATLSDVRTILDHCSAAAGGIDLFHLVNQPEEWLGMPNPFAGLDGVRSPSPLLSTRLQRDYQAFAKAKRSKRGLKRFARGIRQLAEAFGPLTLKQAETAEEIELAFAAFQNQRAQRFADQGIRNIYRNEGMDRFLRDQIVESTQRGSRTGLVLDFLAVGDTILATYIGLVHNRHFTCFANSFDSRPEYEKYSSGNILLAHIIQTECENGTDTFDIGIGVTSYKTVWCETQTLVDSIIAMSALGMGRALKNRALKRAKRFIKEDERLWELYIRARKLIAGRRERP